MLAIQEGSLKAEREMSKLAASHQPLVPTRKSCSSDSWTIIDEDDCRDDFVVVTGPAMLQPWSGNQGAYKSNSIIPQRLRSFWSPRKTTKPRVVTHGVYANEHPMFESSLESLAGLGSGLSIIEDDQNFDPLGVSVAWQSKLMTLGDEERKKRLKAAWDAKPERSVGRKPSTRGFWACEKLKEAVAGLDDVGAENTGGEAIEWRKRGRCGNQFQDSPPVVQWNDRRNRSSDWRLQIE